MAADAGGPVVRVSRGRFASGQHAEVKQLLEASAVTLIPAIRELPGLLYYHAGVDAPTSTVVNVSWVDENASNQMTTLAPMLAQRAVFEAAGVQFDPIANYWPTWAIGGRWDSPPSLPRIS
jgi:hypothetical protein